MLTKAYRMAGCLGVFFLSTYPCHAELGQLLSELDGLTCSRAQMSAKLRQREEEKRDISRICFVIQCSPNYEENEELANLTKKLVSTYCLLDVLEYLNSLQPFCLLSTEDPSADSQEESRQTYVPIFPAYTKPGVTVLILEALENKRNPYTYSKADISYMLQTMECSLHTTLSTFQGLEHGPSTAGDRVVQGYKTVLHQIKTYRAHLQ